MATPTWRGPFWFPINFLILEAIQKFHHYYGDDFLVEYPTGSGNRRTLWQIAAEISRRLESIFVRGADGRRPVLGNVDLFQTTAPRHVVADGQASSVPAVPSFERAAWDEIGRCTPRTQPQAGTVRRREMC